jgi:hypothetical protein
MKVYVVTAPLEVAQGEGAEVPGGASAGGSRREVVAHLGAALV